MKVIITGATGMVGEGVLFECIQNNAVEEILLVSRRHYDISHPKVKELLIADFTKADAHKEALKGYDACFFCAGVSSIGKDEATFRHLTYDTTLAFAKVLLEVNAAMVFDYVSGALTDSTGQGRVMWARVKGQTEIDLMKLGFKAQYNFRPGFMKPFPGQKNTLLLSKILGPPYALFFPKNTLTLKQVGQAMINTVLKGYEKKILEIADIKRAAEI